MYLDVFKVIKMTAASKESWTTKETKRTTKVLSEVEPNSKYGQIKSSGFQERWSNCRHRKMDVQRETYGC